MKIVRKWLLPVLTGLLVLGAAVFPPYLSQMRDARQFGQVHAEPLEADPLSIAEPSTLVERMALYAEQYSSQRTILSSIRENYADDLTRQDQALALRSSLVERDIVPAFFFDEYVGPADEAFKFCNSTRLLLWDAADDRDIQAPSCYYEFAWTDYETYHNKSITATVDAETGLPIQVNIWDTNIAQWFPYTREELTNKADHFFEMMGWIEWADVIPMEPPEPENKFLQLCFAIPGTNLYYWITHGPTTFNISLETRLGPDLDSGFFADE